MFLQCEPSVSKDLLSLCTKLCSDIGVYKTDNFKKGEINLEEWKDIKGYEGLYKVSNLGNVKNKHSKLLKPDYSNKGYACVILRKNGVNKKHRVHRLVAEAFIPNPDNLPEIDHKDENKANNEASNLKWCTHKQNMEAYRKNHPYTICNQQPVYCLDLDEYFPSASEAAVHTGVCRTSILKVCRGQLNLAGGKLWCYAKDKDKKFPK